jgi:hypothetical protein
MSCLVLFYNSAFGDYPKVSRFASVPEVEFTTDRARLREADAVVFHLPEAHHIRDAVKYPGQLWVGWSMESRANTRVRAETAAMAAFDFHMGFDRNSDVWCPYLPQLDEWRAAMAAPRDSVSETVPAVLFQSANSDRCGRDPYLTELMTHLPFHSYGRFLNNRTLEGPDAGTPSKLAVLRRYRFTLAFENSMEPDYVTEKFFQPLLVGSVPVYRGAPNIADFAPGADSFIDAGQLTPRELAQRLQQLDDDDAAYARLHAWRSGPLPDGFVALLQPIRVPLFERLALLVRERLAERGTRPEGRPTLPFGWRGWADTKSRPARAAVRKALKSIAGLSPR